MASSSGYRAAGSRSSTVAYDVADDDRVRDRT